ncbi:hypothetical protein FB475_2897 [Kribbella jejuensis]|uniref:Uncharacterized protein n=1 Tax=Kribbella jejuensis TaxID=236068 RepID=A0A542ETQ7_9ACTN|nr:hypothetical protein FB475_2897 [Kribbella jejuensis]
MSTTNLRLPARRPRVLRSRPVVPVSRPTRRWSADPRLLVSRPTPATRPLASSLRSSDAATPHAPTHPGLAPGRSASGWRRAVSGWRRVLPASAGGVRLPPGVFGYRRGPSGFAGFFRLPPGVPATAGVCRLPPASCGLGPASDCQVSRLGLNCCQRHGPGYPVRRRSSPTSEPLRTTLRHQPFPPRAVLRPTPSDAPTHLGIARHFIQVPGMSTRTRAAHNGRQRRQADARNSRQMDAREATRSVATDEP